MAIKYDLYSLRMSKVVDMEYIADKGIVQYFRRIYKRDTKHEKSTEWTYIGYGNVNLNIHKRSKLIKQRVLREKDLIALLL